MTAETKREISVIVAAGENGEIGIGGDMIWHLRDDLRRFKRLTSGHTVIMGRKTWESLPKKPLPERHNIVITRNTGYDAPGAQTVSGLEEALDLCKEDQEVFIIGGGEIYRQALLIATKIHLTKVLASCPDADTFFPLPDERLWKLSECGESGVTPQGIGFRFETYERSF